jgi:hypothetical protein
LTWYLTEELRRAGADATYRDIMDVVEARVTATYSAQHPQLEGPGVDQLVFSAKSLMPASFVLASSRGGDEVRLEAGHAQGVTKGSVYDVYPPGTKSFAADMEPVAQIEVSGVDVTWSTARVVKGRVTQDAARAVERLHHWPDAVLRVYFRSPGTSRTLQAVRKRLFGFKHIAVVDTAHGYDMLLREHQDRRDGKRYIVTEGSDPTEISPRIMVSDPGAVSRLVEQITHWAKWFNILRIANTQPELGVEFRLKVAGAMREGAAGQAVGLTLLEGERFTIEITNRSPTRLYIALLDLSSDGSVDVLYPVGGEREFVAPNHTWAKKLETFVAPGRNSVRDVLKLIATTGYADFSFLKQGAVRGGPGLPQTRGRSRNPLEELLANAATGTTRGIKQVEVEDWTTVDRVLVVRRRE